MPPVPRTEREQLGTDPPPEELEARAAAEQEAQQQAEQERLAAEEQASRPEWLPEKFKSEDEFVNSYRSLENELRVRGEREREMAQRMEALEATAAQAQEQPRAQATDPLAEYAEELAYAREAGDTRREAELQVWLNQYTLQQSFAQQQQTAAPELEDLYETTNRLTADSIKRSVIEQIPDFPEYEERVGQLLQEEQWRLPREIVGDHTAMQRALVAAYEAVKFKDLQQQERQLQEAGVSSADLTRARKLQAQTLTGATGRSGEPSEADRQVAGMRKALDSSSWEAHISRPAQ